jgi:hypothetical protein
MGVLVEMQIEVVMLGLSRPTNVIAGLVQAIQGRQALALRGYVGMA